MQSSCVISIITIMSSELLQFDHYHHRISVMQLDHLLTHSGLTYPEVSSKAYHQSFCRSVSTVSLPWVIYFEAFCLHVVSNLSCIPVICPKLVLFLTPLQFVHLFCVCVCVCVCIQSVTGGTDQTSGGCSLC